MTNVESAYLDEVVQEILEVTENKPVTRKVQNVNARHIERMVGQCHALLRQQLERKVKLEPERYSKERMEHILQNFKTVMPDIQEAIARRVADSIPELIRQEVRRVLEDALSDLQDTVVEPPSEDERARSATPTMARGSREPKPQDVDNTSGPGGMVQERHGPANDEVYQGNVKVSVEARGDARRMMRFLNQLGSNPQLHIFQLVGARGSVTIWLELRRPVRLKDYLFRMHGVSKIRTRPSRGSNGGGQVLDVVLGRTSQF